MLFAWMYREYQSTYALLYPLYLSFAQRIIIKAVELLDACVCCKAKATATPTAMANELSKEEQEEDRRIQNRIDGKDAVKEEDDTKPQDPPNCCKRISRKMRYWQETAA